MQADKLRELAERLKRSAGTELNDDFSAPGTEKRSRMIARLDAMLEACEELNAIAEGAEADRADARRWRFMAERVTKAEKRYQGWFLETATDWVERPLLIDAIDRLAGAVTAGEG